MPLTGYVWLVPGFGGSELWAVGDTGGRTLLWGSLTQAALGSVPERLIYGSPLPGESIVPGWPLQLEGMGYAGLLQALPNLFLLGYQSMAWGYDWRQSILTCGAQLAAAINARGSGYDHKIVCHSMGCSVVQAALGYLRSNYRNIRVSNVLAITPVFSGSYATVRTWLAYEDSLNKLAWIRANPLRSGLSISNALATFHSAFDWGTPYLPFLRAFNSWPSAYDLLPNPDLLDDPADLYRHLAWDASQWSATLVPPSPDLLSASQAANTGWQTQARASAFSIQVGQWVVITAIDPGTPTGWRLTSGPFHRGGSQGITPNLIWARQQSPGLQYTTQGDNRGTLASQASPLAPFGTGFFVPKSYQLLGSHSDMPSHPAVLSNLAPLLNIPPSNTWPPQSISSTGFLPGRAWPQEGVAASTF